jgi:hypothetical protein
MSLPFNIRANLTLSYFVIIFFNYLQGLHVLPSSIHFVIFKNSFLLNHEDPRDVPLLTGEIDRPSTGRVEPVRGCLNNPSRLEWTTLTSLTAPLAALRSFKKTKEKTNLTK